MNVMNPPCISNYALVFEGKVMVLEKMSTFLLSLNFWKILTFLANGSAKSKFQGLTKKLD